MTKRDPFDFPPETKTVSYKGVDYIFRELTVGENDICRELSMGPDDTFDGRTMARQMIVTGAVEPEMTIEDLEKVPQRLYAQFIDAVNDLNDPATFGEDEDPGNSSASKTSSATKSLDSSATTPPSSSESPDPSSDDVAPTG